MRTSTFVLSPIQKVVFAIVLALSFLFAGCSDSPVSGSDEQPIIQSDLEGTWVSQPLKNKSDENRHKVTITGLYLKSSISNVSGQCNGSVSDFKVYRYEQRNDHVLRATLVKHQSCGIVQSAGNKEDLFYSRYGDTLRIFGRNFVKEELDR